MKQLLTIIGRIKFLMKDLCVVSTLFKEHTILSLETIILPIDKNSFYVFSIDKISLGTLYAPLKHVT